MKADISRGDQPGLIEANRMAKFTHLGAEREKGV